MVGAIDQVGAAIAGAASATGSSSGQVTGQAATPFAGIFRSLVEQTSSLDAQARTAVTGLLNGSGVDVHEAMIASQKSDMAFELALQVRNKAVGAYQQMMQMQF